MALSPTSSRGSGSGTALTVTDGVTPVASVATLDFTAGVTVSDAGGGQANASVTATPSLTPVVTKTANYSPSAGAYVPVDPSGGNFNVTLPAAPANGALVAVEHVGASGSVTMVAGAGDTIDAGGTATNVNVNRRAFIYCYRASDKVWFGLTSLTTAVVSAAAGGTEIVLGGSATAPTFRTGTLDVIATNRPPVAALAMNAQKVTGLADGAAVADAATVGQSGGGAAFAGPDGSLAETIARWYDLAAATPTSGTLYLMGVYLKKGVTYTGIGSVTGGTGANLPTHQIFGLFDDSLGSSSGTARALLATTGDDGSTAWGANTLKKLAFTSAYTAVRTGFHYIGLLQVATTAGQLWFVSGGLPSSTALLGVASALCGTSSTGLTTALPNPAAAPSGLGSGAGSPFYAFVY